MDTRKPNLNSGNVRDAESYHQQFKYRDLLTYQKEFNYGQARINFQLNEVDKDFVNALKMIMAALEKIKNIPEFTQQLSAIDLDAICKAVTDAENKSNTVASIKPPGCEPTYP